MFPFNKFAMSDAVADRNIPGCKLPIAKLNDGHVMPGLGLGTWLGIEQDSLIKVVDNSVEKAVETAIDVGYRHIDTAYIYDVEDQVGNAVNKKIRDGVVKREDLYITTKLWTDKHGRGDVVSALRESLQKLNLDYVDLYLIHWPIATKTRDFKPYVDIDYVETWQGMIDAKEKGLTKSIGISNFNLFQMERLMNSSNVKPAVLQIEVNLNLQQRDLRELCNRHNIVVTGYTPFGSIFYNKAKPDAPPPRIDDPTLGAIAEKYNKTVPQVVLRYLYELGVVLIPKSVSKARIQENQDIFDFQLNEFEREQLKSYERNYKVVDVPFWTDSPYYPF